MLELLELILSVCVYHSEWVKVRWTATELNCWMRSKLWNRKALLQTSSDTWEMCQDRAKLESLIVVNFMFKYLVGP